MPSFSAEFEKLCATTARGSGRDPGSGAAEGHVGCIQTAARAMAEAMDACREYFISLDKPGREIEHGALRQERRRFQAREALFAVLPQARPPQAKNGG